MIQRPEELISLSCRKFVDVWEKTALGLNRGWFRHLREARKGKVELREFIRKLGVVHFLTPRQSQKIHGLRCRCRLCPERLSKVILGFIPELAFTYSKILPLERVQLLQIHGDPRCLLPCRHEVGHVHEAVIYRLRFGCPHLLSFKTQGHPSTLLVRPLRRSRLWH